MTVAAPKRPPRPPRTGRPVTRPLRRAPSRDSVDRAELEALIEEARLRARRRRRRNGAAAAVVALAGLVIAAVVEGAASSHDAAPAHAAGAGAAAGVGNSQIAFVVSVPYGASRAYELRVVNLDGSSQRRLTRFWAWYQAPSPVWSPGGQTIAFMSSPPGDTEEITVIEATGGAKRVLTHHPASDQGPVWSPDGGKLAFTRADYGPADETNPRVVVMNADGSDEWTTPGFDPVWSPDSRWIAFTSVSGPAQKNSVIVVNADGGGQRTLSTGHGPVWSPNGQKVVYGDDPGGVPGVFVVDADGSGKRRLTSNPLRGWVDAAGAWSPDGRRIFYSRMRFGPHGPEEIQPYLMDADGGAQTRLPAAGAWSPDGREILLVREQGAQRGIYVMSADGSGERRLTGNGSQPVWSPDGRMIAFRGEENGLVTIDVMNADGSALRHIARLSTTELQIAWSPTPAR